MDRALALAEEAGEAGEVPIGAVIVESGIGRGACRSREPHRARRGSHRPCRDGSRSRAAARRLGRPRLTGCDLYVTLEPCPMCAQAISFARIRRLYFGGRPIPRAEGVENGARIFDRPSCHHRPEIYGGIGEVRAAALLRDFFRERR